MDDTQPAAIDTRTSEENVVLPDLDAFLDIADAMKPCNIQKHLAIPEVSRQAVLASLSGFVMETIMLVLLFPNLTGLPMKLTIIILTVCVFLSHRENIKRLLAGKENKISFSNKK